MLSTLGLSTAFDCVPRSFQDQLFKHKFPDPVLEFDASYPDDAAHRTLRRTLETAFREAAVDLGYAAITVRDFHSVLVSLKVVMENSRRTAGLPDACRRFMAEAGPVLDDWYETYLPATLSALHSAVIVPLVAHSRLDVQLIGATLRHEPTPNGKYSLRMTVGATRPQVRQVVLDGAPRPMYRLGTTNEWQAIQWTTWGGDETGPDGANGARPVYVQSHALRQLRHRVNLPSMLPYLEAWLAVCLARPRVVERVGSDLLVEYRVQEQRLGYLIVTPLDDLIAVRTFKFLTMSNTPEARMLEQRLRLTRREVDWLGLQELSAFTQTDLPTDPLLRELFEACGCGHLFQLDPADFAPEPKAFAATMRRYLQIAA